MKKNKLLVLNQEMIRRKIQRMAFEIWEANAEEKQITLVGIRSTGEVLAGLLKKQLDSIAPFAVEVIGLSLNKRQPLNAPIALDRAVKDRSVVLIDDVANSGRTLMYALTPLLKFDLDRLLICVLMDRSHKAFPIAPDIVGHSLATTIQERIEVEAEGDQLVGSYLL